MTENRASRASMKYDRSNTTDVRIKLNNKNDADILERLQEVENKQGYIKALIRADIERN